LYGNSHIRQIGQSLACQLQQSWQQWATTANAEDNIRPRMTVSRGGDAWDDNMVMRMDIQLSSSRTITLWIVANHYASYSPQWQSLLLREFDVDVTRMDAVVLGVFNSWEGRNGFTDMMVERVATLPAAWQVKSSNYYPTVADLAAVYTGPILYTSMFSVTPRADKVAQASAQVQLQDEEGRANVGFVNARQYIEATGRECGSALRLGMSQGCLDGQRGKKMHRCMGNHGGHSDLVAWDVTEFLYQHLGVVVD
jgi:hypothetical protein